MSSNCGCIEEDPTDVVIDERESNVVDEVEVTDVVAVAEQGPRGIQGIPGPVGGTQTVTVGASPLSGHSAVAVDANGLLIYADSSNPAHRLAVLGVIGQAYSAGTEAQVQTGFVLEHSGWTWTAGPVFVGLGGALVQTLPGSAVFCQVVGLALSATRILIDLQPPITIA